MLFEEIETLKSKLFDLEKKFLKRQQELKNLKVGQEIYTQAGGGYLEPDEYYPVTILEIDYDHSRVLIHEKGLEGHDGVWASENKKRYIETFITKL